MVWSGWVTSTRALVIEQHSITCKDVVCLAVVDHNPVSVQFGCSVGGAWVEGRGLLLRDLLHLTIQLTGRGLCVCVCVCVCVLAYSPT